MFGALKPALGHVSAESKKRYTLAYCNLCAALSASGAGPWNRFFLVNDVVTIDWLLSEVNEAEYPFACYNCVKGGVIGKKQRVSEHQRFLAAVSSYVCGVKIHDNAVDDPKFKNKSLALVFRPIMKRAEETLRELKVLHRLQAYQTTDRLHEKERICELDKACEPTENCYELLTVEGAKRTSSLPEDIVALLGRYLGRSIYLLDALKDMTEDKEKNQYNVLNILSESSNSIQDVVAHCLNHLKPLRIDITDKLSALPRTINHAVIQKKWDSIMLSVDRQLFTIIKPLNCLALLSNFTACFNVEGTCSKCSSSWSYVTACLSACCPCCSCCSGCEECCPCCTCCSGCADCCPCGSCC